MIGRAEEWIRKTLDPLQGASQKGDSNMMSNNWNDLFQAWNWICYTYVHGKSTEKDI